MESIKSLSREEQEKANVVIQEYMQLQSLQDDAITLTKAEEKAKKPIR